ncbi:hypothetical protein A2Z67_02350 [Candidatus Woesebacteria bacterium RBG_13_36_22]|uniref:Uncharacterized protein n=1 Tax=Candidatus Woesebacteria bacterium RBG_13_36_22 TaxID=1802478 RepID=A0A1F7X3D5_9BACT|nr:MAG: hypothetical protein A2Z67_02350 [Candidatus Woesebacteria bacterium RBG_13_36_22]
MFELEVNDRSWKERGTIENERVEVERRLFFGYKPIRLRIYKKIYNQETIIKERDKVIGLRQI